MRTRIGRWKPFIAGVIVTVAVTACHSKGDSQGDSGRASVVLRTPTPADVVAVSLVVSGGGLSTPRTVNLTGGVSTIETIVDNLPAAPGYVFTASASDGNGKVLYRGNATADIVAKQTVNVLIYLLQVDASEPFGNAVPVIESLVISSTVVAPGEVVTLRVAAHDPDASDTLSYFWTTTGGTLGSANAASTSWSASAKGAYQLTIAVSDNHGASVSVQTSVQVTIGTGAAHVTLKFDNSPVVTGLASNPGYLEVGAATVLTAQASDPDGDTLTYVWTADAPGAFTGASSTSSFTLAAGGTATSVTITVTVKDRQNLAGVGALTLPVGKPVFEVVPPSPDGGIDGGAGTGGTGGAGTGGVVGTGGAGTGGAGTGDAVGTGGAATGGAVGTGGDIGTGGSATGGSVGSGGGLGSGGSTGTGGTTSPATQDWNGWLLDADCVGANPKTHTQFCNLMPTCIASGEGIVTYVAGKAYNSYSSEFWIPFDSASQEVADQLNWILSDPNDIESYLTKYPNRIPTIKVTGYLTSSDYPGLSDYGDWTQAIHIKSIQFYYVDGVSNYQVTSPEDQVLVNPLF